MKWIYYNDIERFVHVRNHSLIRGDFERTLVWDKISGVWNSSGQRSGTCLIRGHFGLELVWSEAASSALRAHNDLRAHTRLIRGHFGLGRSDQRSHLSGTVWSEVISSATSTWAFSIQYSYLILRINCTFENNKLNVVLLIAPRERVYILTGGEGQPDAINHIFVLMPSLLSIRGKK